MSAEPVVVDAARRARFDALFREVYEPLQRYARRRVAPAAVDDVVAETLTVVWRRLDDVPQDDLALAWCFGVARRCVANQRRGEARRGRLTLRMQQQRTTDGRPGEGTEADSELTAALGQLSADDRELVHLWAWEQLAPREIAVVLGLSANAVSVRLHRVRQRLGQMLLGKDAEAAGHFRGGRTEEAR